MFVGCARKGRKRGFREKNKVVPCGNKGGPQKNDGVNTKQKLKKKKQTKQKKPICYRNANRFLRTEVGKVGHSERKKNGKAPKNIEAGEKLKEGNPAGLVRRSEGKKKGRRRPPAPEREQKNRRPNTKKKLKEKHQGMLQKGSTYKRK